MSIIGSNIIAGASGQAGYNINNSLRLRASASAYLSRTPATAGNLQTWTWSAWTKLGILDTARTIFSSGANGSNSTKLDYRLDGRFQLFTNTAGTPIGSVVWSPNVYRDPSAWYHFVVVCDTTNATSTNRFRFYVNCVQVTGI